MSHSHSSSRRRGRRRSPVGQSVVEFTLLLPILLLMTMALMDGGRALANAVRAQNLAKQVALFAAQRYQDQSAIGPVTCLQDQAQQVISLAGDSSATVTLTSTTQATLAYSGEVEVQASVTYPFTPVTPLLAMFGSPQHPLQIGATHAEQVQIPVPASNNPGAPLTATVSYSLSNTSTYTDGTSSTNYYDQISWSMGQGWTPQTITDTTTSTPYTTTFRVFTSSSDITSTACLASPPITVPTSTANGVYSYTWQNDLLSGDSTHHHYWIVAYWPAVPPSIGAAGNVVAAT